MDLWTQSLIPSGTHDQQKRTGRQKIDPKLPR